MIPIAKVNFSKKEENAVLKVLRLGILSQGKEIEEFEKEFAGYIGVKYAIAVSSGTTALHLALIALGLKDQDEIITTPFSFIASTSAILFVNAKPVFVDIGEDFNIDASKIEEKITSKTKAILPVHLFGNPVNMDEILRIAKKYKLKIIEDACQAHGAEYRGKKVGSFGDIGTFSFYATKNMTTGEGGMITTNNEALYEKLKLLRSHGSSKHYHHKILGYNFRMTEMQAAIGRVQLKKLDSNNSARIRNALYLGNLLKNINGIKIPQLSGNKKSVFHHFSIILTKFPLSRDFLVKKLKRKGIDAGIYYPIPIHKQEILVKLGYRDNLPIAEGLSKSILSLPIHSGVSKKDLDYIGSFFNEYK